MSDTLSAVLETASAGSPSVAPAEPRSAARHLLPWLLPALLFVLWQIGTVRGWIAPQVLPPPAQVAATLGDLASSGDLWHNAAASLRRVAIGFVGGSAAGLLLGAALGLSRTLEVYVLPSFNALAQIPILGWLPFLLLLVGIGEPLQYLLIGQAALIPVTLGTLQAFRGTPPAYTEVAALFGYRRTQWIAHVVLPHALPLLATAVRLAFTKAWLAMVVVELVASSEGLGYLIVYGRQLFQLDLVMAAVAVVAALGYVIDRLLTWGERSLVRGRAGYPVLGRGAAPAARWRGWILPGVVILAWWWATRDAARHPSLFVSPVQVWHAALEQARSGSLARALTASLTRELVGFTLGTGAGLVLGTVLGLSPLMRRLIGPSFNTFKQVSLFAWIPLISVWFGLGDLAKVVFLSLAALIPVVTHVSDGIRQVSPDLIEVGRLFGYTRWQQATRVVLPAALPSIFIGVYLALIYSWLATLGAEYLLVAGSGIGNLLVDGSDQFRMDLVLLGVAIVATIGWALNAIPRALERAWFARTH
jgi:sulfonate transport system permease protein